ncbi:chymotrypsin inhibitor [Diachasma alloeum]|uniref:chymotrypsin inhibitor n=1 Tax=Diachasma alloeum TaxID=454923 RepID=UPI000738111C|nr:chymotrypsin inhibitor [Diachasma alloeum]
MSRICFFLIFALAMVFIGEIRAQRCPRNEVWSTCGTRCPPSCRNPRPICTMDCRVGCFCRRGWLRNNRGICVRRC